MPLGKKAKSRSAALRDRAEQRMVKPAKSAEWRSGADMRRLVHELEVHRVELELQNEELRQARAELEANYNELYDFAPVGYFTLGRYGDIHKTNLTGSAMLGQPRTELLGRRFASFVTPESLPAFNEFLHRVMRGHDKESCMVTLMRGRNTLVFAYIEAAGAGADSNCRAVVVDITSAEQARLALRDSEAHLQRALAASGMGVWEYECDSGDIYWSQECIKLSGVDCFSPTLDMLAHIVHPEDAARVRSVFDLALTGGMEQSLECRIIRPDGQVAWISARGQVQTNKSGSPARLVGIVQDITEFKRAQENACPDPARKLRCPANSDAASRTSLRWFSS